MISLKPIIKCFSIFLVKQTCMYTIYLHIFYSIHILISNRQFNRVPAARLIYKVSQYQFNNI